MEPLKTWAVHSFLANAPGFTFSHIPLYDRLYSCSPFYSYVSYFIFGLQTFFRNVFPDLWSDPQQGERIFNLFLRSPAILADLGIALIIFYVLKGKLKDTNKAICGSALYFWLPPLIFAEMGRPFVLPVSVLFLLSAVVLSEKRGWIRAVITGLLLSLCFLTDLNLLLMLAVVLWVVVTYFIPGSRTASASGRNDATKISKGQGPLATQQETTSGSRTASASGRNDATKISKGQGPLATQQETTSGSRVAHAPGGKMSIADLKGTESPCCPEKYRGKRVLEGIIVLIVMVAGFFLISAPLHNFTFKPPQPPVNISGMPDKIQEGLLQPLPSSDARFYPFAMIFGNQGRFYNSTSVSAFNIWALKGIGLPDNGYLLFVGNKGITPGMAGGIVSFIMIIILAAVLAMGKWRQEGKPQLQAAPTEEKLEVGTRKQEGEPPNVGVVSRPRPGESQSGDCSYRGERESQSGDCSYREERESQSGDCSYKGEGESQSGDCSYKGEEESQSGDCSYRGERESQSGDCSYKGERESQSGDCSYRGEEESQSGDCSYRGERESQLQTVPAYFYFALVFFILFLFPTGGHDFSILAVFPFLILIFFTDIRARILFYGVAATCWINLFFSDHLDLSPHAFTTVPAIIRLLSGINILLFMLGMIFFLMTGEEERLEIDDKQDCLSYRCKNSRTGAEKFEARLFEILPSLKDIRDWFAQPGNLQIALVLLAAFILRMWRLGTPGEVNFDEEYYVPIAGDYFYGLNDTVFEASHPPFATYIIGIGIGLLGDNVFGWRIMSVFFSVMQIGVLYLFAKKLFKNHIPALFAGFLLTFDFLHFVHSRLGMLDIFSSFFNLLSYYLFYLYLEDDGDYYLWVTGVSLALGAACKWTSLFAIGGIIVIIASAWICSKIVRAKFPFADKLRSVNPLKVAVVLLIIPFLFQIFSFLPLLGSPGAAIEKMTDMMHYHENLAGKDEISSPWWSWLFVINPVQYVQTEEGPPEVISESGTTVVNHENRQILMKSAVTGMGNPLVWWLTIPAFIICIILSYRERNPGGVYACLPFIFQYLPWAFVNRITYLFYMTDVVPYICLMVAFCLYKLYETGRMCKIAVGIYLTSVAVSFFTFYPLLSAWFVRPEVYDKFRIFEFWNFQ